MSKLIEMTNNVPASNGLMTVETNRAVAEVQGQIIAAKNFPRDENQALEKILKACNRKKLAETGLYSYPRGHELVTGPSIRLAEVLAQSWGNIDFGIRELERRDNESVVMAYAHDLESNLRQTKIFTVRHIRETKKGNKQLSGDRDVYELTANMGARRVRACILGIIPGDIVDAAQEACEETLKENTGDPKEKIQKMLTAFSEFEVTREQLEKHIGYSLDSVKPNDIVKLQKVYMAIKDGMKSAKDFFGNENKDNSEAVDALNNSVREEV